MDGASGLEDVGSGDGVSGWKWKQYCIFPPTPPSPPTHFRHNMYHHLYLSQQGFTIVAGTNSTSRCCVQVVFLWKVKSSLQVPGQAHWAGRLVEPNQTCKTAFIQRPVWEDGRPYLKNSEVLCRATFDCKMEIWAVVDIIDGICPLLDLSPWFPGKGLQWMSWKARHVQCLDSDYEGSLAVVVIF